MERIILFDGVCNICNSSVQFILKRDPKGIFKFTSLQGSTGQNLLHQYKLDNNMSSIVLIEENKIYTKSTAALRVAGKLTGGWKLFAACLIIPRPIRDFVYQIIANNRYKWFGIKESCMLPLPEWKNRFLE